VANLLIGPLVQELMGTFSRSVISQEVFSSKQFPSTISLHGERLETGWSGGENLAAQEEKPLALAPRLSGTSRTSPFASAPFR
jgi:hypothetical protein